VTPTGMATDRRGGIIGKHDQLHPAPVAPDPTRARKPGRGENGLPAALGMG
jgi:hypothetical protein